jgi:hypothetical protein
MKAGYRPCFGVEVSASDGGHRNQRWGGRLDHLATVSCSPNLELLLREERPKLSGKEGALLVTANVQARARTRIDPLAGRRSAVDNLVTARRMPVTWGARLNVVAPITGPSFPSPPRRVA